MKKLFKLIAVVTSLTVLAGAVTAYADTYSPDNGNVGGGQQGVTISFESGTMFAPEYTVTIPAIVTISDNAADMKPITVETDIDTGSVGVIAVNVNIHRSDDFNNPNSANDLKLRNNPTEIHYQLFEDFERVSIGNPDEHDEPRGRNIEPWADAHIHNFTLSHEEKTIYLRLDGNQRLAARANPGTYTGTLVFNISANEI